MAGVDVLIFCGKDVEMRGCGSCDLCTCENDNDIGCALIG
jgi:hypothetical protein